MKISTYSKYIIKLFLVAFTITFTVQALLWIPVFGFTKANFIRLVLGLIPIIFLDRRIRSGCLYFSMFMAGVTGFLYIGFTYLDCIVGHALGGGTCFTEHNDRDIKIITSMLKISIPTYAIFTILGIVQLRRLKRKSSNNIFHKDSQPVD